MLTKEVYCSFAFESWHNWPGATGPYSYLASSHRHMFHVFVQASVTDNEREIEIIEMRGRFLYYANTSLVGKASEPVPYSCETMAEMLINHAKKMYGHHRSYSVEVSEDGENGAVLSYVPEPPAVKE